MSPFPRKTLKELLLLPRRDVQVGGVRPIRVRVLDLLLLLAARLGPCRLLLIVHFWRFWKLNEF